MRHHPTGSNFPVAGEPVATAVHYSSYGEWLLLQDAVVQTDMNFNITGWNSPAEILYSLSGSLGKNLFEISDIKFVKGSLEDLKKEMACSGCWTGELVFTRQNGEEIFFRTTANYMIDEKRQPVSIMLVSHNITEEKRKETQLISTEYEYRTLVNTLFDGVIMMKSNGVISACNKRAANILGYKENELTGKIVESSAWQALKADGSVFPPEEFPAVITLRTGRTQQNVVMSVLRPGGERVWISINSKAIYLTGMAEPDAVAISFKDITEDRKKQEKLKQAETLFSSFVNNSKTAAWIYDAEGYILLANDIYNKITNAPEGGAKGLNIKELFPNEFGEKLLKRNRQFLLSGKDNPYPRNLVQADGSIRTFLSYLFLIDLPGGEKVIGGQALDITETMEVSEKLKESEELFKSFMSSSSNLRWIYTDQGKLVYANPRFIEELGYNQSIIDKYFFELPISEEIKSLVTRRINEVLEYNTTIISEDEITGSDGSKKIYAAHWFLIKMPNGRRLIGGHAEDITENKLNIVKLKELKETYEYVLKATSDGIWDYDLKNDSIYRSDQFSKISGYPKNVVQPTLDWWFDKIHPEDQSMVKNNFASFLQRKEPSWNDEYRFRYADGTYRYIYDQAFAVYRGDKLVRLVGSIQDITDRKELERKLIEEQVEKHKQITQAAIRAQELERDEISKELHDNVNQILSSAKLYMSTARNFPGDREMLLEKAIEYQNMAIEEIRKFSRSLNTSIVYNIGLQDNIEGIVYNLIHLQCLEVKYLFNPVIEDILSNEQKLMVLRIIQEQTTNITKYAKASTVVIQVDLVGTIVKLVVKDDGIGFDTKEKAGGIGLSNISDRVMILNGTLNIISAPGQGCSVEIEFPV